MGKPIVHWEIVSEGDPKEVQRFYADLFGWKIDADNPLSYGISGSTDPNLPGHVTVYVSVDDPDAVLKDIESRGGKTVLPTTEVVPGTTIALFTDPWGSLVGLSKA